MVALLRVSTTCTHNENDNTKQTKRLKIKNKNSKLRKIDQIIFFNNFNILSLIFHILIYIFSSIEIANNLVIRCI